MDKTIENTPKTMQFEPNIAIFDTTELSPQHPVSPEHYIFSYYPSQYPENLHYHDFIEIGYCEKGSGIFYVDGQIIPFNGKCSSIIYCGQCHIAKSVNAEKSLWHFLYVDINSLFANSEIYRLSALNRLKFNSHQGYSFPVIMSYGKYPDIYELCSQVMKEAADCGEGYLNVLQGLMYSLLQKHDRLFTALDKSEKISRRLGQERVNLMRELGDVLNYVNENYTETITIEQLISFANMSKSNLQRKMIAFTGKSPLQYVNQLRLKHAVALLVGGKKSVSQIAIEVGYNSLSSFNRMFAKEFGTTPSSWRKQQ